MVARNHPSALDRLGATLQNHRSLRTGLWDDLQHSFVARYRIRACPVSSYTSTVVPVQVALC